MFGYKIFNDSSIYDLTTHNNKHEERRCNMIRYYISIYEQYDDNEKLLNTFDCRHFEVNNDKLTLYPSSYLGTVDILLGIRIRIKIRPYIKTFR